jgi:L-iditol 2-dehydrogenase
MNAYKVSEDISFRELSLTEPLSCVVHSLMKANIRLGDTVVIIGCGPMGLLHLKVAKAWGAGKIVVSDLFEERLQLAKKNGADVAINPNEEELIADVQKSTNGEGADIVVVTVEGRALASCVMQGIKIAAKEGVVNIFASSHPPTTIEIDPNLIHYRCMSLIGTVDASPVHFMMALKMIKEKKIDLSDLITSEEKLHDINRVLNDYGTNPKQLKIAIIP